MALSAHERDRFPLMFQGCFTEAMSPQRPRRNSLLHGLQTVLQGP